MLFIGVFCEIYFKFSKSCKLTVSNKFLMKQILEKLIKTNANFCKIQFP